MGRPGGEESSAQVATRITSVAAATRRRNGGIPNATLPTRVALAQAGADPEARRLLEAAADTGHLSARALGRVARVARTIADLDGMAPIGPAHVAAAIALRAEPFGGDLVG